MPVRPRRRRWLVSLPALVISGFLFVTAAPALGAFNLESTLRVTWARATGDKVGLVKLRQQAEAAREGLQEATEKYEQSKERLQKARGRLERMREELDEARARLEKLQEPIDAVANAAYQHAPVGGIKSVLTSKHPQQTMRAAVDFAKLTQQKQAMLREINRLLERKKRLVESAHNLAQRAQARAEQLNEQRQQIRQASQEETHRLIQAMQNLGMNVSRGERLPLGCHPGEVTLEGYPNGLIPTSALCPLPQEGHYLRADAAVAFAKLNAAYADHFGEPICVTDSYRSLAVQQDLYYRKPGLAAVPGTSNHGLALAVDLCGGINSFGTDEFIWMKNHARQYGWMHPDWAAASGSTPEPWHWEYYEAES